MLSLLDAFSSLSTTPHNIASFSPTAPIQAGTAPKASGFFLDEQVSHLLRRAHQRASALFLTVLADAQLTPTQFFAMARLHEMGKLSQNRLGRLAAMDPATIQGVIRRLHERRSEERRVGKECVSTCRSRWSSSH